MSEKHNPKFDKRPTLHSLSCESHAETGPEYRVTLGQLENTKIGLFNLGITVSPEAREAIQGTEQKPLSTGDYASTSGIALYLGQNIYVNAPFVDNNGNFVNESTPYSLDFEPSEGLYVACGPERYPVQHIPVPGYWDKLNKSGVPYKSLAVTHIDRVRISPVSGCAIACQFCDSPYTERYRKQPVDDLIDAVKTAVRDEVLPAKHVLISGGTPKPEDYEYENQVYSSVAGLSPNLAVDIMMAPASDSFYGRLLEPAKLKSYGIHGLAINMELFNPEIAKRRARGKYDIGQKAYLDFIEESVQEFGLGRIRSLLMVGIEPLEDTLKGVQALAERGCDPVLSPFRPSPLTPLRKELPPTIELQREAYLRAREIVSRYSGVELGPRCIPCQHNTLAFPYQTDDTFYHHTYNSSKPS